MKKLLITTIITCLPLSALAAGQSGYADLDVNPISSTNFEVMDGPDAGPSAYWCAAGLYVENTLGLTYGRIYLADGRGNSQTEPGRKAVQFSTVKTDEHVTSVTASIHLVGKSFSSGSARRLCNFSISDR